ncbi:hypothetical protein DFH06DRAFT_1309362 [Mycena polygramma]|nr:hypothetical protein DFH06DRAFT_1309362 [Mycena polygramma]
MSTMLDSDKTQNGVAAWLEELCARYEDEKAAFAEKMRLKEERQASRKRKCGIAEEGDDLEVGTMSTMITRSSARRAKCRGGFIDHCDTDRRGQETTQQDDPDGDADRIELQAGCSDSSEGNEPFHEQHLLGLSSPILRPRAASCAPNSPRSPTLALVPEQSSAMLLSSASEPAAGDVHINSPNLPAGATPPPEDSKQLPFQSDIKASSLDSPPLRLYEPPLPLLLRLSDPAPLSVPDGTGQPRECHPPRNDRISPPALHNIAGAPSGQSKQVPFLRRTRDVQTAQDLTCSPLPFKLSDLPLPQPLRLSELGPLVSPAPDTVFRPLSKRQKLGPSSLLNRVTANSTDYADIASKLNPARVKSRGSRAGKHHKRKKAKPPVQQQGVRSRYNDDEKTPMAGPSHYIRRSLIACGAL